MIISRQGVRHGATETDTHLHVKKHDGYHRPLGGFVDDVCVGQPTVDKT